jgi:hypothetical protein
MRLTLGNPPVLLALVLNLEYLPPVGFPVVDGLAAFHRGAYAEAVELVLPVRVDLGQIDGVRVQRDVVDWTLTEVAPCRSARQLRYSCRSALPTKPQ